MAASVSEFNFNCVRLKNICIRSTSYTADHRKPSVQPEPCDYFAVINNHHCILCYCSDPNCDDCCGTVICQQAAKKTDCLAPLPELWAGRRKSSLGFSLLVLCHLQQSVAAKANSLGVGCIQPKVGPVSCSVQCRIRFSDECPLCCSSVPRLVYSALHSLPCSVALSSVPRYASATCTPDSSEPRLKLLGSQAPAVSRSPSIICKSIPATTFPAFPPQPLPIAHDIPDHAARSLPHESRHCASSLAVKPRCTQRFQQSGGIFAQIFPDRKLQDWKGLWDWYSSQ